MVIEVKRKVTIGQLCSYQHMHDDLDYAGEWSFHDGEDCQTTAMMKERQGSTFCPPFVPHLGRRAGMRPGT